MPKKTLSEVKVLHNDLSHLSHEEDNYPALQAQLAEKTARLEKLEAEHTALVAVAEAARHHFASVTHGDDDGSALNGEKLENALRNLAAVRGSDIPTSQQVSGKIYAGSHVAGSMDDNNNDN